MNKLLGPSTRNLKKFTRQHIVEVCPTLPLRLFTKIFGWREWELTKDSIPNAATLQGKDTAHQLAPSKYNPSNDALNILHEDDDIVVVNKPSGLLSVPGRGGAFSDCLEARVKRQWPTARSVHRLDLPTSGVIIFALHKEAQGFLGRQFGSGDERKRPQKRYTALVAGRPLLDKECIQLPLVCDWPRRPRQMVSFEHPMARKSTTKYEVLTSDGTVSRLLLQPITGRSHQLRVHMQALGHPIVGDKMYASDHIWKMGDRLMLHATSIELTHPSGRRMYFEAPAPF